MMETINNFTLAEVQEWLVANGFASKVKMFASCEINGELLMELTYKELTEDLGFNSQEANGLIGAIQLETAPVVTATPCTPPPAATYGWTARSTPPALEPHIFSAKASSDIPSFGAPQTTANQSVFTSQRDERNIELESVQEENRNLKAENARLQAMYDGLLQLQLQQQGCQSIATSQPAGQPSFHDKRQDMPAPAPITACPQQQPSQSPANSLLKSQPRTVRKVARRS